jgi:lysylphosphatidylglycerol synthetase-like protein (DUF2156 family)
LKEQQDMMDQFANLKTLVNKSSIKAVDRANAERNDAICVANAKVREAQIEKDSAIRDRDKIKKESEEKVISTRSELKQKTVIMYGLLIITYLLYGFRNNQLISDFINFFRVPFLYLYKEGAVFIGWLQVPTYTVSNVKVAYAIGWAWFFRIASVLGVVALVILLGIILLSILRAYKSIWCNLSLKVLSLSLAVITTFGDIIKGWLSINLVLLFLISQVIYIIIWIYISCKQDEWWDYGEWERIQNG